MHPEAYAGFGRAIVKSRLDQHSKLRVLDVGGQDVNGTVHDYFTHSETEITTLDLENADIIADARTWVPDRKFDVVIATELFEHTEHWREILLMMRRALDQEGPCVLLATCASTGRPEHGATGAPLPAAGEWYQNVPDVVLRSELRQLFPMAEVEYNWPPGDAYMWASGRAPLGISVLIPSIPGRKAMRETARVSAWEQIYQPLTVLVQEDSTGAGPAVIRNELLQSAETEWVAFLDDDDWLYPEHLLELARAQMATGADLVFPWFDVDGGHDPFPQHRGRQWDPADPHQFPITVLVRREAVLSVGGFQTVPEGEVDRYGNRAGEDWRLWLAMSQAGYRFHHIPDKTWVWRHHNHNTSGLPSRVPKTR